MEIFFRDQQHIAYEIRLIAIREVSPPFGEDRASTAVEQEISFPASLKSEVVSLQTAHSWANAGVLLGDACIGSRVAFEAIKLLG